MHKFATNDHVPLHVQIRTFQHWLILQGNGPLCQVENSAAILAAVILRKGTKKLLNNSSGFLPLLL